MSKPPRRPNLLLITTDQQRWDAMSHVCAAGYRTPNIDRLARLGVSFENGYTPTPVCTPARVSMITGLYPPRHGAFQIGLSPVPALDGPILPRLLSGAGYRTALFGKTHFVARPVERSHVAGLPPGTEVPDGYWDEFDGPYLGFEHVRANGGHTSMSRPNSHHRRWLKRNGFDLEAIDRCHRPHVEYAPRCAMELGRWEMPPEATQTAFVTDEAISWIAAQPGPWFAMLNYQDPHPPLVCPEPYYSAVDMTGVELFSLREGELDDKPPFYRSYVEREVYEDEHGASLQDELHMPSLFTYDFGDYTRDAVRAYIGLVNMLDEYIGRLLDALEASGDLENTLVCLTADHGEMLGNHGLWEKGIAAYDDCQRVPAILAWPAAELAEHGRVPHHFNLVDIAPTFLDAAGVPLPVGMQGFSHLSYLRGDASAVRDWSLVDFYTSSKLHQQTLVTNRWKLVLYRHHEWGELYDRDADPDQLSNLYDDPRYESVRARLTHRLVQVNMECAGVQGSRDHMF